MKEPFINWRPSTKSELLLSIINTILEDYRRQGYRLTLRQLYYQLVAKDIIPNKVKEYTRLGHVVSQGRLAGLIDWNMIEDRTRRPIQNSHWENPKEIIYSAANSYYLSRWKNQDYYIEVWCEKDAVSNIIGPICSMYDVLFMANRGYSSLSAIYEAYNRLEEKQDAGYMIRIIYLGDHDPSGIDMVQDIKNRLGTFFSKNEASTYDYINNIMINNIVLTIEQIKKYKLPENPAKVTDSRYKAYAKKYGQSSWELDALEPKVLSDIVTEAILRYVDLDEFSIVEKIEQTHKDKIKKLADII